MYVMEDILGDETWKMGPYEIALMIDVIEHIEDYVGFLRKAKVKAKLDVSVQTIIIAWPIQESWNRLDTIKALMRKWRLRLRKNTGSDIVDHSYIASRLELPNRGWNTKRFVWPRRFAFFLRQDLAVRIGWLFVPCFS